MHTTKRQAAKEKKMKNLKARPVKGEHVTGGATGRKKIATARFQISVDGQSIASFSELSGISH